jgi:hypothetical protein
MDKEYNKMKIIDNIKIESPCLITEFKNHTLIKNDLLKLINDSKDESHKWTQIDNYFSDNYTTDWHMNDNTERPWVKFFFSHLTEHLNNIVKSLGYNKAAVKALWYQQYLKNESHGWHTHSENYTGVYYLEFTKNSPTTQVVLPYSENKKINLNVKEGDFVVFPSFLIHRGAANTSEDRKTIISFNFNYIDIEKNLLLKLK